MTGALIVELVRLLGTIIDTLARAHDDGHVDEMQAAEIAYEASKLAKFGPPPRDQA